MVETYVCPSCQQNIECDDSTCEEFIECMHCGEKLRVSNAPMLAKDSVIGDYIVKKRIGVGGMGEVYLAEQQSMQRPVALKVLQSDLVEDKSYLERFYREVRTLAQIQHPNIVNAIETGYEDNICYFSMSYIEGKDLKEKLDSEGKMSEIDALHVILNVAEALKFVWERHKLIHRDIKPANIILTDENEVKLMDLGISKTVADNKPADLTMAGMMVGSPYYVSPEQARASKDIDWRADMYSLGASFYHMIVGDLPFDSDNTMAIIAAHLSKPIPDPRVKNPDITDESANIIGQMMQKDKEDRFASWDDAIAAIEDAIAEVSEHGAETTILDAVPKKIIKKAKINLNQEKKTKHAAKPDIVEKIKDIAAKTIFGNLYIRFVILVMLLFITFLSFFKVVKESIHEEKVKTAQVRIAKYKEFQQESKNTKKEIREAFKLLDNIKAVGYKKADTWADNELNNLKKIYSSQRVQRKSSHIQNELSKLKEESYKLEKNGQIDNALQLWRQYKHTGAYSTELKDDIRDAVEYLKRKKHRNNRRGI